MGNFVRFQWVSNVGIAFVEVCWQLIVELLREDVLLRFFVLEFMAVDVVLGRWTVVPLSVVFRGARWCDGGLLFVDDLVRHRDGS